MGDWVQQVILTVYRAGKMGQNHWEVLRGGPLGVYCGAIGGHRGPLGPLGVFLGSIKRFDESYFGGSIRDLLEGSQGVCCQSQLSHNLFELITYHSKCPKTLTSLPKIWKEKALLLNCQALYTIYIFLLHLYNKIWLHMLKLNTKSYNGSSLMNS